MGSAGLNEEDGAAFLDLDGGGFVENPIDIVVGKASGFLDAENFVFAELRREGSFLINFIAGEIGGAEVHIGFAAEEEERGGGAGDQIDSHTQGWFLRLDAMEK